MMSRMAASLPGTPWASFRAAGMRSSHPRWGDRSVWMRAIMPRQPVTAELGLAMLFARLGLALDEQKQPQKALYFARIANWLAPSSDAAKLALAELFDRQGLDARRLRC
jgi:hypothetical protein